MTDNAPDFASTIDTVEADPIDAATRTLGIEAAAIASLSAAVSTTLRDAFNKATATIAGTTGRVIVTGMGKSGHIARKIAATFASTGTPSHFVHPGEASHGDLGMIAVGDTVIAISNSGEATELADTLTHCKRFSIPLISITSKATSTLATNSDIVLLLPSAPEACPFGMAPTTSTTLTLALGDALAVALMQVRGFTKQNYGVLHPGGKLGKLLVKLDALMHTGAALPLVPVDTKLTDALVVMTNQCLGCLMVTNEDGTLAGFFTGADLTRAVKSGADISSCTIDDVMNRTPKTMPAGRLAAEAAAYMNSHKLTQLVIMDSGKPVGLLHTNDLLKAGIA